MVVDSLGCNRDTVWERQERACLGRLDPEQSYLEQTSSRQGRDQRQVRLLQPKVAGGQDEARNECSASNRATVTAAVSTIAVWNGAREYRVSRPTPWGTGRLIDDGHREKPVVEGRLGPKSWVRRTEKGDDAETVV